VEEETMKGLLKRRPSPSMIVAILALIVALCGTAIAGGVLTKKKVNKVITNRAPGLSVASAKKADSATSAINATNATTADKAKNADAVGGTPKTGLGAGIVLGSLDVTPPGAFNRSAFGPSGPCNTVGIACAQVEAAVPLELRDFRAIPTANVAGADALQINLSLTGGPVIPLCTVSVNPCTAAGPISIPAGQPFLLNLNGVGLAGDEEWSFSYRLTPG
jgi:hypothetical protein